MVRVLTVDDHVPFLRVAHELMRATPGFESVGEVSSGEEALAIIDEADPDLVLIDIHMPGLNGIETTRRIHRAAGRPVVVLISAQDPAQLPAAAQTCGAAEVLRKQDLAPARLDGLWRAHASG